MKITRVLRPASTKPPSAFATNTSKVRAGAARPLERSASKVPSDAARRATT
ncbi:hypothetical protein GS643_10000 [Xanthomonas hortorum pv. gardneri]